MNFSKRSQIFFAAGLAAMMLFSFRQLSSGQVNQQINSQQINYAQREVNASPAIKNRLATLRAEIQARKLNYRVAYTTAMDFSIAQLTGLIVPRNLGTQARTQNARARQLRAIDDAARDTHMREKNLRLPEVEQKPSATAKSLDWRKMGKVTAVRNQNPCGSCWDFAACAAYESNYLIRNGKMVDLSEQEILDCGGAGGCKGGWHTTVYDYMISTGAMSNADYTDYKAIQNSCSLDASANPFRAVAWGYVTDDFIPGTPNQRMPTVAELKEALVENGPVAVCLLATEDFKSYGGDIFEEKRTAGQTYFDSWNQKTFTIEGNGNATGVDDNGKKYYPVNHVVLLIGWDDVKGAWLIKNSWGVGWGDTCGYGTEKGYGWIKYNADNIGAAAAWVKVKSNAYVLPRQYYQLNPNIKPMPDPVIRTEPVIKANPITKKPSGQ